MVKTVLIKIKANVNKYFYYYVCGVILLGLIYLKTISISIENFHELIKTEKGIEKVPIRLPYFVDTQEFSKMHNFAGIINSNINQKIRLNISADDILYSLKINGNPIAVNQEKNRYLHTMEMIYFYNFEHFNERKRGFLYEVELKKGANLIEITNFNKECQYSLKIKQKFSFSNFIILFVMIIFPFFMLVFEASVFTLQFLKKILQKYQEKQVWGEVLTLSFLVKK